MNEPDGQNAKFMTIGNIIVVIIIILIIYFYK
jgi:hypothetical protein